MKAMLSSHIARNVIFLSKLRTEKGKLYRQFNKKFNTKDMRVSSIQCAFWSLMKSYRYIVNFTL